MWECVSNSVSCGSDEDFFRIMLEVWVHALIVHGWFTKCDNDF